jgi:hypothetical protein
VYIDLDPGLAVAVSGLNRLPDHFLPNIEDFGWSGYTPAVAGLAPDAGQQQ